MKIYRKNAMAPAAASIMLFAFLYNSAIAESKGSPALTEEQSVFREFSQALEAIS